MYVKSVLSIYLVNVNVWSNIKYLTKGNISDSPKRFQPIHWLAGIAVLTGVIMVLVAHGHYTVDVLIAYYVTTRLWYIYHTLANNSHLKVSCIFLLDFTFATFYVCYVYYLTLYCKR